jgi:MFS family permease
MPPTTASTAAVATPAPFKEVWLISLGHSLTHWYPATFYLLLPLIGKELGLSYSEIGFIMTVQYTAGALSNVPGGMVVDTIGYKGRLMALSLFWVGVPYLLIGLTSSYAMLLACMILIGIGNNLWHPAAISTLAQRFPERKGLALSFHGMGGNLGEAIAPLVIGALLAVYSWRTVVVINIVPGLVMATLLLVYLGTMQMTAKSSAAREGKPFSFAAYLAQIKPLVKDRAMVMIALSSLFRSGSQSALLTFLPVYLANRLGYSSAAVGLAMFFLQAAAFTSAPIAGHLSDRMGRKSIMTGAMGMSAIVVILMALVGDSVWFVGLVAAAGFFMYATRPVIQAWALETAPASMAGTTVGIMFGVQAVGGAIMPWASGSIADAYSLQAIFYVVAVTIILSNICILFVPDSKRSARGA